MVVFQFAMLPEDTAMIQQVYELQLWEITT